MPRPPFLLRHINFRQNESAGNEIPTQMLDAEFNDTNEVVNQLNQLLRGITDASGRLVNVAAAIAQSLVGTERFAVAAPTTVFTTAITWDASFSSGNVLVVANGETVDTNDVSVANNGGVLEVTLSTSVDSGWVLVAAYSQGAGIATELASTAVNEGASLVGIYDVDGNFVSTNVEGALAELATSIDNLLAALGTLSKIWTSDGTTVAGGPATGDFQGGGFKITDIADGVANTDAVTLQQLLAVTQNLDVLLAQFIRADGSVDFTQDQSMGGNKLTDVGTPTSTTDAANKAYVDAAQAVAEAGSLALDGLKTSTLRGTLTGPVTLGESASATADADQTTDPDAVTSHTICGVPKPGANDHVANKKYVDEVFAQTTSFPLGGADLDGTFGSPVTNLTEGIYHFEAITTGAAQALTGPMTLWCSGNVSITGAITSSYPIRIFCEGNVTLGAVTCRGLEIQCTGDLTLTGAITANSGVTPSVEDYADFDALPTIGVFKAIVGGEIADGGQTIIANDVLMLISGDATFSGSWSARWQDSGGQAAAENGTAWPSRYGSTLSPNGKTGTAPNGPGGGGGGGTGGGAGGAGEPGSFGGAGGDGDPYKDSRRGYLQAVLELRRGSGGAAPEGANRDGGDGGGRISIYVAGNAVCTGATFSADGYDGDGQAGTNDAGGGGAGILRFVCRGMVTDGTFTAIGGDGFGANGGGGGGGGVGVAASGYSGVQTQTVTGGIASGGGGVNGTDGTSWTDTFSTAQIDDLVAEELFAL